MKVFVMTDSTPEISLVAHVKGDMLRDPAVQVAFPHADQVRAQVERQRDQDQPDQGAHVPPDQAFVDDPACQDGRKQAAHRRDADAGQDQQQLFPVRLQVRKDTFEQVFGHFRRVLLFLVCQIAPAHRTAAHAACHCHFPFPNPKR